MSSISLKLGYKYLRSNKGGMFSFTTVLAITGLMIGIASLIVVTSIMNGFEKELENRILGVIPHSVITSDIPIKDYCGTCTECIDACPTNAIIKPYVVDGSKCISYLTIELKDELLPKESEGKMDNWMFGCDICQEVCPWNRFSTPHKEPMFEPHPDLLKLTKNEWEELTEDVFQNLFKKAAVKRTKYKGLKRNITFLGQK